MTSLPPTLRLLALSPAAAEPFRVAHARGALPRDARPHVVDEPHSAPCRVCLRDAAVGETVLLFGHGPFATTHAYATHGPVFVHAAASTPWPGEAGAPVPEALTRRLLSVRAHDRHGAMRACDVTPGHELATLAARLLAAAEVAELHVHHARAGCFACRIVRA